MAVFTKNLRKHVFVHPEDQHKLQNAIKIVLLKDRKKYSDSLEGALLDVNGVKVIGDQYLIVNGYLSMEVIADFEVFSPSVGMALDGVINKVNRGHYGCLVMNLFNASLSVTNDIYGTPKEGDMCSFVVTKIVIDGDLLFMKGELTSVTPKESDCNLNGIQESYPTTPSNSSFVNNTTLIKVEKENDLVPGINSSPEEKKKKRHKRKLEESISESTDNMDITKSHKKHKKNHRLERENSEYPPHKMSSINHQAVFEGSNSIKVEEPGADNSSFNIDNNIKTPKKHKKKHKSDKESLEFPDMFSVEDVNSGYLQTTSANKIEQPVVNESLHSEESDLAKSIKKHRKKHKSDKESLEFPDMFSMQVTHLPATSPVKVKQESGFNESSCGEANIAKSCKKHKKKHKSFHSMSASDETESDSQTVKVKQEIITPVKDIVVKSEPITPMKSAKKSRRKAS